MKKTLAYIICLGNVLFISTYYAISKGALEHIDAVVFACLQMLLCAPAALTMLVLARSYLNRERVKRGVILGASICCVLLSLSVALSYTSATETAFFPCLNGLLAALLSSTVLRQRVPRATWAAALLVLIGMLFMMDTPLSASHWRGNLIALVATLAFTCYIFLVERSIQPDTQTPAAIWATLGIQLLVMAAGGGLVALYFGNWQAVHPTTNDLVALGIIGLNVLIPVIVFAFIQRFVSPTTVVFFSILEPLFAAGVAALYLGERFPPQFYLGAAFVFGGVLLQTAGGVLQQASAHLLRVRVAYKRGPSSPSQMLGPARLLLRGSRSHSSQVAVERIAHRAQRWTGDLPQPRP